MRKWHCAHSWPLICSHYATISIHQLSWLMSGSALVRLLTALHCPRTICLPKCCHSRELAGRHFISDSIHPHFLFSFLWKRLAEMGFFHRCLYKQKEWHRSGSYNKHTDLEVRDIVDSLKEEKPRRGAQAAPTDFFKVLGFFFSDSSGEDGSTWDHSHLREAESMWKSTKVEIFNLKPPDVFGLQSPESSRNFGLIILMHLENTGWKVSKTEEESSVMFQSARSSIIMALFFQTNSSVNLALIRCFSLDVPSILATTYTDVVHEKLSNLG